MPKTFSQVFFFFSWQKLSKPLYSTCVPKTFTVQKLLLQCVCLLSVIFSSLQATERDQTKPAKKTHSELYN
jgi:hypothetical protein